MNALLKRWRRIGWAAILALALAVSTGAFAWPDAFFPAYWFGLMFWVQLSVGCLLLVLLDYLTGGHWGAASRPLLALGMTGLLILLPLFIPVLLDLASVFSWTRIDPGHSPEFLVRKQFWLNVPFFTLRSLIYLAVLAAGVALWRRSPPASGSDRRRAWSGPALVAVVLTISFASIDWMMALEPAFYSSVYPFHYFAGAMVSTMALLAAASAWFQWKGIWPHRPDILLDLGKLLFAAVLFWGYIVLSQFIIIWNANLPHEIEWYLARVEHGWLPLTVAVLIFHFAVPFAVLLPRAAKSDPRRLMAAAGFLFLVHMAEVFWLMAPGVSRPEDLTIFYIVLPPLIGLVWLWWILGSLPAAVRETRRLLKEMEPARP